MQARNRAHYVQSWRDHVTQLATLALAATSPEQFEKDHETHRRIREELFSMIERAADQQKFTE
jgi:hypothetical protein